jgi:hypothetical protein
VNNGMCHGVVVDLVPEVVVVVIDPFSFLV